MVTQIDFDHFLNVYRTLWNNRKLPLVGDAGETLKEAILRELKDENSHPRIRRPVYEKFYFSVKRILDSSLLMEEKLTLLNLHKELLENYIEKSKK